MNNREEKGGGSSDTAVPAAEPEGGDGVVLFLALTCACIAFVAAVYRSRSGLASGWRKKSEPGVPSGLLQLATPVFYDSVQLTFERQWDSTTFEREEEFTFNATFEELTNSFGNFPPPHPPHPPLPLFIEWLTPSLSFAGAGVGSFMVSGKPIACCIAQVAEAAQEFDPVVVAKITQHAGKISIHTKVRNVR
jgi:hypothetical protein